jgi:hypothetical protein
MPSLDSTLERRAFLGALGLLGLPSLVGPGPVMAQATRWGRPTSETGLQPGFRQDLARVQEVVGASHGRFERVRELVEEQPGLAKAAWDWGFGDWESALGAAAHMGRRDIALFLIEHGARPTLFSAAMLGEVDVVRAMLERNPALHELPGAHGIPLMRHARAGGEEAASVVDYLSERFGVDDAPFGVPEADGMEERYGGRFRFEGEHGVELVVGVRNGWLMIGSGEQPSARVLEAGTDTFHPTGAPAVRLAFDVVGGRAIAVVVTDGPVRARGERVGDA